MRSLLRLAIIIFLFAFLTLLTQVGGVIYAIALLTFPFINKSTSNRHFRTALKILSFIILYSIGSFLVTPILATQYHRVPLPMFETNNSNPETLSPVYSTGIMFVQSS